ncbi:MAG: M48 family metallopeptidase [Planctomycetes bacterium]|nr:M48 family metallopeptidase [Planctomycetota bacterium]
MASFDDLIRENKRNTVLLCILVTIVLCALASVIALVIVGVPGGNEAADFGGDVPVNAPPPISYTLTIAVVAALAVAGVMILFSYYGGASALLAVSGAKEIRKSDDPQLFNVVEEMTIAGNLPMPRIFLINDTALNAFATGRDPQHAAVAITRGLRDRLTRDELQAVMAHELAHVRNYDIRLALFVAVLVGVIVVLADLFARYMWWGGPTRRRSNRDGGGGVVQLVLLVVALVLIILAPLFAKLIQLALSRQREYLADATAASMTRHPEALASALAKLEADTEVLEAANRGTAHLYIVNPFKPHERRFKASSMFRTHPDIKERISRLMSIAHGGR